MWSILHGLLEQCRKRKRLFLVPADVHVLDVKTTLLVRVDREYERTVATVIIRRVPFILGNHGLEHGLELYAP